MSARTARTSSRNAGSSEEGASSTELPPATFRRRDGFLTQQSRRSSAAGRAANKHQPTDPGGISRSGLSSAFGPDVSNCRWRTHSVSTPESMMRCAKWIFFGPSSRAIACATARRPNLALAKAAYPAPPLNEAVAPVKKILPLPRGNISLAASRPARKPELQAISHTLRSTRSVVSRIAKLTLAPMLKMQTSSGACPSASPRKEMISSSLRASSERAWTSQPTASISFTKGSSLAPFRRRAF